MNYRDIVECIKLNQIKQGISVKTLANRVGVHSQVITDIRGYRMKVSPVLFDKILAELSVCDISVEEKEYLLSNQSNAQAHKHKKYLKEKERKMNKEIGENEVLL